MFRRWLVENFLSFFFIQSTYKSKQHSNVKSPSCAIDACSSFGFLWIVNFVLSSNSEKIVVKIFSALHNFRRPLISRSQSIVIGEKSANFIELARVLAWESRDRDFRGEHFILHSGATKVQNIGNYAMKPWEFCPCNSKINVSNLLPNDPSNCLPSSHTQDRKVPMVLNLVVFLQTHRGCNIQERYIVDVTNVRLMSQ